MPEIKTKIDTYMVDYICDDCGKGTMQRFGGMLLTAPPQYTYRCNNCGAIIQTFESYPSFIYEQFNE